MKIVGAAVLASLLLAGVARAEVTRSTVLPSKADPTVRTLDSPHAVYVDRDVVVEKKPGLAKDRHELLLFLTGTDGEAATSAQGFCNLAAELGDHVVSLTYADDVPASACANDASPAAFETFRMAIIAGGDAPYQQGRKTLSIARSACIEIRLARLLQFLRDDRPDEGWGQFLQPDGTIKWEAIAVAGQSQGGGHAALIGIKHAVARVLCFGAPKDYSRSLQTPAAWYRAESATPKARFFAFNHRRDPVGCTPEQLLENLKALGLDAAGAPADVDTEPLPYHHARMLFTSTPQVGSAEPRSDEAKAAHRSAISTKHADRWRAVWTYLLTE